jgi:micrococcal nuclease
MTGFALMIGYMFGFPLFTAGSAANRWRTAQKVKGKGKPKMPGWMFAAGLVIAFSGLAAGCEQADNPDGSRPVQEQSAVFQPEIKVKSKVVQDQLKLDGTTNLPDHTALVVTIAGKDGEEARSEATVKNGSFSANPIPVEKIGPGSHLAEVRFAKKQPGSVLKEIGEESLSGDLLLATAKVEIPQESAKEKDSPPKDVKGIKAKVIRAVDGDTLVVHINGKEERVRMILVDTPETKHPQMGVQPFGPGASEFTSHSLTGKTVTLELGIQERDRYGRLLAYIWLGNELFNKTLVEKGLARVAVFPPNTKYLDEFNAAQEQAKKKAVGIWSVESYATDHGFKDKNANAAAGSPSKSSSRHSGGKCVIKGSKSGIYHVPGSKYYEQTTNVVRWFCSEEEAEKAGYRAPKR